MAVLDGHKNVATCSMPKSQLVYQQKLVEFGHFLISVCRWPSRMAMAHWLPWITCNTSSSVVQLSWMTMAINRRWALLAIQDGHVQPIPKASLMSKEQWTWFGHSGWLCAIHFPKTSLIYKEQWTWFGHPEQPYAIHPLKAWLMFKEWWTWFGCPGQPCATHPLKAWLTSKEWWTWFGCSEQPCATHPQRLH